MGRPSKSGGKAARDELRAVMLAQGSSVEEIAEEFRARWHFTPLAAYRYAAGLTQMQAASRYNEVVGDDHARVDSSLISKLEGWPVARGAKAPTAYNLTVLALVYGTTPYRLIGRADLNKLPRRDQLVLQATHVPVTTCQAPVVESGVRPLPNAVVADDKLPLPLSSEPHLHAPRMPSAGSVDAPTDAGDGQDLDAVVLTSADQSRKFAAWTESSELGRTTMDIYRSQLSELSRLFLYQPVATFFPRLVQLRSTLLEHLYKHQPLRRSRDLYALSGMASLVLAHASHVLGHHSSGVTHAQFAELCAQEAGHVELHAWALGTQALLAEAANRPQDALRYLRAASESLSRSRIPGTAAVRLASYEARLAARVGQRERAIAALAAAADACEVGGDGEIADLDDIGGILSFPDAKQKFFSAETHLLLGRCDHAERDALAAIGSYTDGPPEQSSYGDLALAWLDVAAARLANNDLDGMYDAIHPVLSLPSDLRIAPLRDPLSTLASALTHHRYRGLRRANKVRTAIESYDFGPKAIWHS